MEMDFKQLATAIRALFPVCFCCAAFVAAGARLLLCYSVHNMQKHSKAIVAAVHSYHTEIHLRVRCLTAAAALYAFACCCYAFTASFMRLASLSSSPSITKAFLRSSRRRLSSLSPAMFIPIPSRACSNRCSSSSSV